MPGFDVRSAADDRAAEGLVRVARTLRYQPPYAWTPLVRFLAARAIPGVETVVEDRYRRVFEVDGTWGWLEVRHRPERRQIDLAVWLPNGCGVPDGVGDRISRVFDVDAEPDVIAAHFVADPVIGPRVRGWPGLRVPGAWDLFELGIRAILGQQVTVKGASTLAGRLVAICGRAVPIGHAGLSHVFPRAEDVAVADLSTLGVPARRRDSIRTFAEACASGEVSAGRHDLDEALGRLPGFGDWTVQYVMMRACSDPDAFPASDLWLRRSAGAASVKTLAALADAWRPFRAYAAMYLWQPPAKTPVTNSSPAQPTSR
jgi:AraC family transcriptional regulator of adaptative response / DNA-3-methyladenine glycosylase II